MALSSYTVTITKMCNWALTAAGARNRIIDIDNPTAEELQTEEYLLSELFFWQAVMEALQDALWVFARDRVAITKDATDPTVGSWKYRLEVPTDSLTVLYQIHKDDDEVHYPFKREGDYILTSTVDSDDKGYILYLKKITDVAKYSPLFVRAAYVNLAIKFRSNLKGVVENEEWDLRLQREYNDIIDKAIEENNLEGWVQEGNEDVLEAAEGCGQNGYWKEGKYYRC